MFVILLRRDVAQGSITASSSLFTPPQELIFEVAPQSEPVKPKTTPKGSVAQSQGHSSAASVATAETEDSYSFDHPMDVAALTDLKTIELGHKYR
jgi:hypothetical protein